MQARPEQAVSSGTGASATRPATRCWLRSAASGLNRGTGEDRVRGPTQVCQSPFSGGSRSSFGLHSETQVTPAAAYGVASHDRCQQGQGKAECTVRGGDSDQLGRRLGGAISLYGSQGSQGVRVCVVLLGAQAGSLREPLCAVHKWGAGHGGVRGMCTGTLQGCGSAGSREEGTQGHKQTPWEEGSHQSEEGRQRGHQGLTAERLC